MTIFVQDLVKTYGSQRAVDGISFEVKTGEIVGFLGPNGAGKSTTMKILTCYLSPNAGDVRFGELSVHEDETEIKKKIGYLPENNPLYTDMYLVDYLRFCAGLQGVERRRIDARTYEMIGICGLAPERHKKIGELSKGYRQRVGLAQAMIHDPELLVLDEPTSGLDPNQIVEIRRLITNLGQEKTVILSSHILPEVEATCKRILIVSRGRIVADGATSELQSKRHQQHDILTVRFSLPITADALEAHEGITTAHSTDATNCCYRIETSNEQAAKKAVFECAAAANGYLENLQTEEKSLEAVFAELTQ